MVILVVCLVPMTKIIATQWRRHRDHQLARISHQPGAVVDGVPLLREKQCRRNAPALLALRQAVAHVGEKCGLAASVVLEMLERGNSPEEVVSVLEAMDMEEPGQRVSAIKGKQATGPQP